jgi:hypothetical protein
MRKRKKESKEVIKMQRQSQIQDERYRKWKVLQTRRRELVGKIHR